MSAYNRLNQIWSGQMASEQVALKRGIYTVPKICPEGKGVPLYPPSYSTLHHELDESHRHGGYFNLKGAYPFADCESCKVSMTERPCLGHIDCNGKNGVNGAPVKEESPVLENSTEKEAQDIVEGYLRRRYGNQRRRF